MTKKMALTEMPDSRKGNRTQERNEGEEKKKYEINKYNTFQTVILITCLVHM
jgi:hypothetical protein